MKIIPGFRAGKKIKLTKVASFDPNSKVKVGDVLSGELKTSTSINKPIEFTNGQNTGDLADLKRTKGNDYIVNTGSALYFMQVLD
jgi:hypothetical protein